MKIVIINGFPQQHSGKDTFVKYCLEKLNGRGKLISTVDFVKKIAYNCGWNGEKTPQNRKFLSDLKKLLTEWNDIPFKKIETEIENFYNYLEFYEVDTNGVIFIMCREPEEILRFKNKFNATTLLIKRELMENITQSNDADSNVLNFNYDYVINNNGTLLELKTKAIKFLNELINNNL